MMPRVQFLGRFWYMHIKILQKCLKNSHLFCRKYHAKVAAIPEPASILPTSTGARSLEENVLAGKNDLDS